MAGSGLGLGQLARAIRMARAVRRESSRSWGLVILSLKEPLNIGQSKFRRVSGDQSQRMESVSLSPTERG